MGFFDKLKAAKNMLTGGAAKVYLESDALSFDAPFKVKIKAQTLDAPVKISRVYLQIRGVEQVAVPDVDVEYNDNGSTTRKRELVKAAHKTYETEITLADAQELPANESFEWETEIELPAGAQAIYEGHFCRHSYQAFAGLDCFGNDPDSGWVDLRG